MNLTKKKIFLYSQSGIEMIDPYDYKKSESGQGEFIAVSSNGT